MNNINRIVSAVLLITTTIQCTSTKQIVEKSKFVKEQRFEPNWESLDARVLPEWYDQAKVGIFIHWGVYAVPSFGSEWFWTNWRTINSSSYIDFMRNNYKPGFTYQEFARDFTGEHFNATEWAELFAESGAKYVVLTSKHHDGYALWPSRYSFSWNSVDIGLHRDVISELAEAVRADNRLRFGLYHSLFEWYNPMYVSDRSSDFSQNEFVEKKILPELRELVMTYKPEVIWSDGEWEASYKYWNATDFLAWLYNDSPVADTVVSNDRWGHETLCNHGGFFTCQDRFNPGVLQRHKWENAMTLDKRSWGHRNNAKLEDFLTSEELIDLLVITVSCGGNILVNVGPDKTGIIQPIFAERLRDMGKWLTVNGQAIYQSQPWIYQNDTRTPDVWYTSTSTPGAQRMNVYAIVLEYPFDSENVELFSLFGRTDDSTVINLLGYPHALEWETTSDSVIVNFPNKAQLDKRGLDLAWTLKIDIPAP
ncbi:hypothetical protein HA402_004147 [Bradysia odoriphaga]|nr:hypothetical protein HA402_004147 [Bradysia odoriphaga]